MDWWGAQTSVMDSDGVRTPDLYVTPADSDPVPRSSGLHSGGGPGCGGAGVGANEG